MNAVKLTVCGDGGVGKTSLLITYTCSVFPGEYIPTVFENYNKNVTVDGETVELGLWDTHSCGYEDRLRILCYPNTDVFLVCFSVVSMTSFDRVADHCIAEIRYHCPETPIVLCGTQIDLRNNIERFIKMKLKGVETITFKEGCKKAREINAHSYVETSALTQEGMQECFDEVVRVALEHKNHKPIKEKKNCILQ